MGLKIGSICFLAQITINKEVYFKLAVLSSNILHVMVIISDVVFLPIDHSSFVQSQYYATRVSLSWKFKRDIIEIC